MQAFCSMFSLAFSKNSSYIKLNNCYFGFHNFFLGTFSRMFPSILARTVLGNILGFYKSTPSMLLGFSFSPQSLPASNISFGIIILHCWLVCHEWHTNWCPQTTQRDSSLLILVVLQWCLT